jgi:hypothetical protein
MNQLHQQRAATVRWSPRLLSDIVNAPGLGTAAERLGASGIPVFPCVPGGKRPLTAHGFQDASADPDVINFWWRRQPDANIGVPTGTAGGIDVVDVDVHKTGSGFAAFEHARRAGFVEGWARLVRTPSGGLHAHFLHSGEREQRSWQVPSKHIDFRGDGGYIIVPPSQVTGDDGVTRPYRQIAVAELHQHRPMPPGSEGSSTRSDRCAHRQTCPWSALGPTNSPHGSPPVLKAVGTVACSGRPAAWPRRATT